MAGTPLKFRFTLGDADAAVKAWVQAEFPGHLIIQHEADAEVSRTHWHALLISSKTVQCVRQRFNVAIKGVPPSDFSLGVVKVDEEERYVQYMCHGSKRGDTVHVIAGTLLQYPVVRLAELHNAYWHENDALRSKKKGGKSEKPSTVQELRSWCSQHNIDTNDRYQVTVACLRMFRQQERLMQKHYIQAVVTSVVSTQDHGLEENARLMCNEYTRFG